ncbi:hypothetical protein ABW19_dt0203609 [Dactylella cylindrospora]|nr:hypothetical protein ABW19_dt0203609 [Dactylella cylindrospora]
MKYLTPLAVLSLLLAPAAMAQVEGATEIDCEGKQWTAGQVQSASEESLGHIKDGTTVGNNDYPHEFNNREGFDFGDCAKPFYEFPIVKGGDYDGGPPNTDRVVIGSVKGDTALFCGAITHTNANGNQFNECQGSGAGNGTIKLIGRRTMRRGARLTTTRIPVSSSVKE